MKATRSHGSAVLPVISEKKLLDIRTNQQDCKKLTTLSDLKRQVMTLEDQYEKLLASRQRLNAKSTHSGTDADEVKRETLDSILRRVNTHLSIMRRALNKEKVDGL